jgi:hypothetical protein
MAKAGIGVTRRSRNRHVCRRLGTRVPSRRRFDPGAGRVAKPRWLRSSAMDGDAFQTLIEECREESENDTEFAACPASSRPAGVAEQCRCSRSTSIRARVPAASPWALRAAATAIVQAILVCTTSRARPTRNGKAHRQTLVTYYTCFRDHRVGRISGGATRTPRRILVAGCRASGTAWRMAPASGRWRRGGRCRPWRTA